MTWACAAVGRNTHAARAADSKCGDRGCILLSAKAPAWPRVASTATRQAPSSLRVSTVIADPSTIKMTRSKLRMTATRSHS
jgi:hypothetical protein